MVRAEDAMSSKRGREKLLLRNFDQHDWNIFLSSNVHSPVSLPSVTDGLFSLATDYSRGAF